MDFMLAIILAILLAVAASAVTALWLKRRTDVAVATLGAHQELAAAAQRERDAAIEARVAAERGAAEARATADAMRERLADFERVQQEMLHAAKAAVTDTAQQVSSKLLDDHKREAEAQRAETEKRVHAASEALVKQVTELGQMVTVLGDRVEKTGDGLETMMRAISSPGGAGQMAEVGLANMLQSFGLEVGRDFVLQSTTVDAESGKRLRPDAVVFLPTDTVLVIDCKASKFVLEIAESEGKAEEKIAYENLARTMNQHLRALAEKDYRSAVLAACRQAGRGGDPHVISLMYLPNEAALEKLRWADPEFYQKARAAQIIPAGPAGLYSALLIASAEIRRLRQMENQKEIVERCGAMLDSVGIVLGHAIRAGSGLKSAVDHFAKLTASINGRLLPRALSLTRLGIEPSKPLPGALPSFSVQTGQDLAVIDGDAAEVESEREPRLLE